MLPLIHAHRNDIATLCRRFHVCRMDVFGSASRQADFDPAGSDIDLLVTYQQDCGPTGFAEFLALRDALSALLGRDRLIWSWPARSRTLSLGLASSGPVSFSMQHDPRGYLWDARQAADRIADFVRDRSFTEYMADAMLRSAVERQFEIVGKALTRLASTAPDIAARIPDLRPAIAMRNILIHGYARIDDAVVWRTAKESLPLLREQVANLLTDLGDAP